MHGVFIADAAAKEVQRAVAEIEVRCQVGPIEETLSGTTSTLTFHVGLKWHAT